jgi:anion-transporting  ArsA/GET3 family ATPase
MAVVLKYKGIAGFDQLAGELLWLSRGLKRPQGLLIHPRACGFLVVTRPEHLPALETIRLIEWLRRHRIPRRALIVNGVTPPGCARCRRTAARERRPIATFISPPSLEARRLRDHPGRCDRASAARSGGAERMGAHLAGTRRVKTTADF